MSHIDAAKALIRAIDYDTFSQIETAHHPLCTFHSFRGPILHDALAITDWHRTFARNYADLTYTEAEFIEQGDTVAVCTTLEAKGYDWRRFHQRTVDVMDFDEYDLVTHRRLYAMLRDIEFEKQVENAFKFAAEAKGGKQAKTEEIVRNYYTALLSGDDETARGLLNEKCAHIDSIYGVAAGADAMIEIPGSVPKPAFGSWRVTRVTAGNDAALVELAIDDSRPRAAHWVRVVDETIGVVEVYWMLREIGFNPYEEYRQDRHQRRVIMPT